MSAELHSLFTYRRVQGGVIHDGRFYARPRDGRCEFGWVVAMFQRGKRCWRSARIETDDLALCRRHSL